MTFSAALSGLQAASKELDVIGNNVSNAGTAGFKESRAEFADVYATSALGTASNAVGSGVKLTNVRQSFSQGNIKFTNNNLDLAISGQGFFTLNDGGTTAYSRAGSFQLDNNGFLINGESQRLQGLTADPATGTITGLSGDLFIDASNISPSATTSAAIGVNLDSTDTAVALQFTATTAIPNATTYNNVTSTTVFDSLGNAHVLSVYFIKAEAADAGTVPPAYNANEGTLASNEWYMGFQVQSTDGTGATVTQTVSNAEPYAVAATNFDGLHRMSFDSTGGFSNIATPGAAYPGVAATTVDLAYTPPGGGNAFAIEVDFSAVSQFGSDFSVQSSTQDGFTTGRLDSIDVGTDGLLFGRYTNGESQTLGQVQLANFPNVNGLQPNGQTSWLETFTSGQPLVGNPGTSSLGLIQSGGLEESNVDLTGELVKLITAQRNFQASAQTIKTNDTITQTIINLR